MPPHLLHADQPEAWPVTDEKRAEWIGARVHVVPTRKGCDPAIGTVVGVWRGWGVAGVWHILTDEGDQFAAFTTEMTKR